jgi:hypothetical protein
MRLDEFRDELKEVAARTPRGTADARAAVLGRGRRLVRRRRLGRALVALVAVVASVAGVGVWRSDRGLSRRTIVTTPSTTPGLASRSIDAALLWSDGRGLVLGDPNTGHTTRISNDRFDMFLFSARVRDGLVFGSALGPSARLLPDDTVRSVGPGAPFAAADGESVFLSMSATSLEQVDPGGARVGGPWQVPTGYELSGKDFGLPGRAVAGGLLVQTADNNSDHTFAIWNPRTNSLRAIGHNRWGVIDTYTAPGASTSLIAWIRSGCATPGCSIALTDTATGRTLDVPAPAGHYGYFYGGAFSPDGRHLAVFASTVAKPVDPAVDLTIVDTATAKATLVQHAHLSVGEPDATADWSPSGDWVFFSSFGDVFAYRTGTTSAVPLPFHFTSATRFVVVPPAQSSPTTTTTETPTQDLIPADARFSFFSTPIVASNAMFAIETEDRDASPRDARIARIDISRRRIVATYDLPGAGALALAGDRLWVGVYSNNFQSPSGVPAIARLVSLDPRTLASRGDVTLPGPGANGLASVAGNVWILSGDKAIRLDAATERVAATVRLALPPSNPFRTLAVSDDGTRLFVGWATPQQTDGVTEFDATTGHELHQNAQAGGGPVSRGPGLTYAGSRLWVTFPTGLQGESVALRTADLTTTGEAIGGPNSIAITPDGNVVWVIRATELDCVTPNDTTLASHALSGGGAPAAATTPNAVYVTTGNGIDIIKRDPACAR